MGNIEHLNRSIPPLAHTPMYVWHKYWGRKTWNVVSEYIKHYSKPGEIVFDPFAGSGVSAIEALRHGRKAVICDLNPVACEIVRLTLQPVDTNKLVEAFMRVESKVKKKILDLYQTSCRECGTKFPATCFIWKRDKCIEVRYKACPNCGHRCMEKCLLVKHDKELLEDISTKDIDCWFPTNSLYYSSGRPFKKKEHFESIDQLFTKRNLLALAWLIKAIEEEPNKKLRDFLKIAFTSMSHLASKMMPVGNPKPTNHYTYFSSPGWTQHSYWAVPHFMEQNVWDLFVSALMGHQGLINAKNESNEVFGNVRITNDFRKVFRDEADICIIKSDCLALMEKINSSACYFDYIFTDPPYDASIQYGELAYMWASWLKMNDTYTDEIESKEIIRNERQGKTFDVYRSLLKNSLDHMLKVLKPGRYLTMTFHNPTFKVRNTTIHEAVLAGFEFQNIHHQPLAQMSAKSMLQPFGSAQGDFYLRFQKPKTTRPELNELGFDAKKFELLVVEAAKTVIAERAEPTPYTIIINYIDPQLAQHGYWKSHPSGLDVKSVLQEHLDKEFRFVPAQLGGAAGQLWWLNDDAFIRQLKETPLSERVEQTIFRLLQKKGRISFTDAWNEVSIKFPNSLTSDSMSIKEALEIYARKVGTKGEWLLKPEIIQSLSQHNILIERLAWIGMKKGYDFWIGHKEQTAIAKLGLLGTPGKQQRFGELISIKELAIDDVADLDTVAEIDVLWLDGKKVVAAFEVECTTTMTSALLRGSNLPASVPKYMLIPEQRAKTFDSKMKSPLFAQHFNEDNWGLIYFGTFDTQFQNRKYKINLNELINIRTPHAETKQTDTQTKLFN